MLCINVRVCCHSVAVAGGSSEQIELFGKFGFFKVFERITNGFIRDLVRIKKMSAGVIERTWRGDVNADALIADASDLSDLHKKLLGLK